ncbi:MAG: FAD-binding oxidoreductase [Anaerolineaceae bacterium]|nr:FAD-binding oxidoreductase [Anaerolineaceae bacterium]
MHKKNSFDVLVIGAGVIGCSIAYRLAAAGLKTALLDQSQVGAGASGANLGMVQSNDVELGHSIPLVTTSFARYGQLGEELGMRLDFKRTGILHLLPSEEHWNGSLERAAALAQAGIACEMLPARAVAEIEPMVDPETIRGAMYAPDQGQINPFRLMWAYLRRAIPLGLSLHTFTRVTGFELQSGRVQGVHTTHGEFSAGTVVLATAAWTRRLGEMIGQNWRVHTFRASAMVTEPQHSLKLRSIISTADHIELALDGKKDIELAFLGLRQTADGNFLISQADRPGESLYPQISALAPKAMAIMTGRYFPILRRARLLRSWTAPTTYTEDGCPLIGPVPGVEGLILATAFRSSLINTPLAGEIAAELVTLGRCEVIDIRPFALDREMGKADTFYVVESGQDS